MMGSEMLFWGHKQEAEKMARPNNNFTQTCSRFSQFLKERRSLGHLDVFKTTSLVSSELDIKGGINVFPKNMGRERMSLELFPLTAAGVENSSQIMADSRESTISNEEPENTTPSMTIFYGGRVLVFNELPEDKAREIVSLARNGMMMSSYSKTDAQTDSQIPHNINGVHEVSPQGVTLFRMSDMPIARRVSLHRFMEKRKHRVAANAPYQLHNNSSSSIHDSHPTKKFKMMTSLYEQQLELKL